MGYALFEQRVEKNTRLGSWIKKLGMLVWTKNELQLCYGHIICGLMRYWDVDYSLVDGAFNTDPRNPLDLKRKCSELRIHMDSCKFTNDLVGGSIDWKK